MIKICLFVVVVSLACVTVSFAKPETADHGAASHKSLHFKEGVHNPVFDHEALFGSRNSDELADLPDDLRMKRLRTLAKSHDTNNDDIIDAEELKAWVLQSFKLLDQEEANEKFPDDDENSDGKVTLAELIHKAYGYSEEDVAKMEAKYDEASSTSDTEEDETAEVVRNSIRPKKIAEKQNFKLNLKRHRLKEFTNNILEAAQAEESDDPSALIRDDRKRFDAADLNKDKFLDKDEYVAYLQPYDFDYMADVEMERSMNDMDKDKDGSISFDEFLGGDEDEETRLSEKTNFDELDKDKDGKLNKEELRPWAMPDNADVANEEVEHLMQECDEDKDGNLSVDEIVSKEEEFLGSSATDYGRHLHFVKDEL